jgi:hypothetical protein
MDNPLRLALWNANGLTQHAEELRTFISYHNVDVMLISTPNIQILERFQSKALRMIVDAPCMCRTIIRRDLHMTSVKKEIRRYRNQYSARLSTHPNDQILTLMELPGNRRLRRHVPNDLPNRFLV